MVEFDLHRDWLRTPAKCCARCLVMTISLVLGIIDFGITRAQDPWSLNHPAQQRYLQASRRVQQPGRVAPGHYLQTGSQEWLVPLPPFDPNERRVAMAPHGYASGTPGPVTSEGAPLGGIPDQPLMSPQNGPIFEPPPVMYGQPMLDGMIFEPTGPEAVVYPNGVVIHEADDLPVSVNGMQPGAKEGVLQKVELQQTYLPDLAGDSLTVTDLENSFTLGIPFPDRDSPLLITPGFDIHLLSGPTTTDLPAHLFDTYVTVRWLRRIPDSNILLNSSVSPGWFSDWESNETDALRVPGQSLIIYDWTPQTQVIVGLVYLNRVDLNFLPAGGIVYQPNNSVRIEAVFPRPKIAARIRQNRRFEDWLSIAGEFGGGQWAIERADGRDDILVNRDYRVVAGLERKNLVGMLGGRLEVGYVFGRVYQYRQTGDPEYEPADTLLVRGGITY
jgi:hypothetical protein